MKSQLRSRAAETTVIAGQNGRADVLTVAGGPAQAMTTLGPGLDALDGYFSRFLPQLVLTALSIPVFLTVLAFVDITTAVTVAVTMPLIPVFMVLYRVGAPRPPSAHSRPGSTVWPGPISMWWRASPR